MFFRSLLFLIPLLLLIHCGPLGNGNIEPPVFAPVERVYIDQSVEIEVTLSSTTRNALIYYTLDMSEPSETNGTLFTAPFSISSTTTIKAIAHSVRGESSQVIRADFVFHRMIAVPGGTFDFRYGPEKRKLLR